MSKITLQTELGPIDFQSPQDAAAFFRAMRGQAGHKVNGSVGTLIDRGHLTKSKRPEVNLLRIVLDSGSKGIPSADLAERLGLSNSKGLGSLSNPLSSLLDQAGFKFDDAIKKARMRGSDGTSMHWRPGPRLPEIVRTVEGGGL